MTRAAPALLVLAAACQPLETLVDGFVRPDHEQSVLRRAPWSCEEPGPCPWDCTGDGLVLETPGVYLLDLTADCTLDLAAWGAGGGGAASVSGGGGGGGTSVITDDGSWPGREWVIAGGGGGGGAGDDDGDGHEGGGGGGGAFATTTVDFAAGERLWLRVGGGGEPGCAMRRGGNGGAPDGGYSGPGPFQNSEYGGGRGGGGGDGAGVSLHGGGGGGSSRGRSVWGGGGGQGRGDDVCGTTSKHGIPGQCKGPLREGGGGGGGGGLGTTVIKGDSGAGGHEGGLGGPGAKAVARGPRVAIDAMAPGHGGDGGALDCSATAGTDGQLLLTRAPSGTGLSCPPGELDSCDGGCEPAKHLGDGICDAALDCAAHARDDGDCPESGLVLPDWMVDTCPHVTSQSGFCLTLHREWGVPDPALQNLRPSLIGLDDGAHCTLFEYDYSYAYKSEISSAFEYAAWVRPYRNVVMRYPLEDTGAPLMRQIDLGDQFYADVGWMVISDYDYDWSQYKSVTSYRDGFIVSVFNEGWRYYPRFDELVLGGYTVLPPRPDEPVSYEMSVDGDRVYRIRTAGSTNEVFAIDLVTGAELPSIFLQGDHTDGSHSHDGIEVIDGRIWIAAFHGPGDLQFKPYLAGFNLTTGALEVVYPGWEGNNQLAAYHGLHCYRG